MKTFDLYRPKTHAPISALLSLLNDNDDDNNNNNNNNTYYIHD